MNTLIQGLHHVTAMSGAAQANLNFYTGLLGLRLVKKTVNFDAPDVYHLYYGNESGAPGTIMTFFPFPGLARGRVGAGQTTLTSFSIPATAIGFWEGRFKSAGVSFERRESADRIDLLFRDPDGMPLALVATSRDTRPGTAVGSVPEEQSIRGFWGVTLSVAKPEGTLDILTRSLDHQLLEEGDGRFVLGTEPSPGAFIEVLAAPQLARGLGGSGTIHHIAFATPSDESQLGVQARLYNHGHMPTEVLDRQYFHSIYFREPGGVLFEVATVPPGFQFDEPLASLGQGLKLPPWAESKRTAIEAGLAPLSLEEALRFGA